MFSTIGRLKRGVAEQDQSQLQNKQAEEIS